MLEWVFDKLYYQMRMVMALIGLHGNLNNDLWPEYTLTMT